MGKAKKKAKKRKKKAKKGEEPLTMTALEVENVLRLKAVTLKLDGGVLVIEGGNEQGKSSLLRVVDILLAGKDAKAAAVPLHVGATEGHIVGTFGDYIVRKSFSVGKSPVLTIKSKTGGTLKAPQSILAGFLKYISLDISKFMEMSDREQVATLGDVMGFDSSGFDAEHERLYDERKDANREVKRLRIEMEACPCDETAPEEEVSVADLMAELETADDANRKLEQMERDREYQADAVRSSKGKIEMLKEELAEEETTFSAMAARLAEMDASLATLSAIDTRILAQRITDADAINAKVRAKAQRAGLAGELSDAESKAEQISEDLADVMAQRERARLAARDKLPLDELDITEDAVLYNGTPLSQAGSSAQLRVSAAIAIELNQDSRVKLLLIDDAEKLEAKNIEMVLEMADDAGFHVWMTRVLNRPGEESAGSVVIEDGTLKTE